MSHKDPQPFEPWRAVLREGDPAGAEPGLDPREVERMRRAVLAARPEPRQRFALTPVWASALAASALVLTVGVLKTIRTDEAQTTIAVRTPPAVRVEPAPPPVRPIPPTPPEPEAPVPAPARSAPAPQPEIPPETRIARAIPEPELPEPDLEADPGLLEDLAAEETLASAATAEDTDGALPRQVQFSTPGGTRIIWMLAPEESSTEESHE